MSTFLRATAAAALIIGLPILSGPLSAADTTKLTDLRNQGWQVVSKREHQKKLPGVAPYENLTRVIQITTFVMSKDGKQMTCDMAYDSQRDRITETCRDGVQPQ